MNKGPLCPKIFLLSGLAEESFFFLLPPPQLLSPQSRPVGITWFISNALDLSFQDKVFVPWSDKYKSMTIVCRPAASSLMTSKDPHHAGQDKRPRTTKLLSSSSFFLSCARVLSWDWTQRPQLTQCILSPLKTLWHTLLSSCPGKRPEALCKGNFLTHYSFL